MATKLNASDLEAYMQQQAIPGELVPLDVPTPTVEAAAQAVGAQTDQIVKSIMFSLPEEPVLAITCGLRQIERRALAARFAVGRKRVKLAAPEAVLEIAGYEVGAMPPFGHHRPLQTLIDPSVLENEEVYAGGGEEHVLVRLSPRDIVEAARAEVLDLHNAPQQ